RRPERLCAGLVAAGNVRLPCPASQSAVAPAMAVLPTPPLPPKKTYLRSRCSLRYCRIEVPIATSLAMVMVLGLAEEAPGEPFDHRESGDVPLHLWDERQHLAAEGRRDLAEVTLLHAEPVAQIGREPLAAELGGAPGSPRSRRSAHRTSRRVRRPSSCRG